MLKHIGSCYSIGRLSLAALNGGTSRSSSGLWRFLAGLRSRVNDVLPRRYEYAQTSFSTLAEVSERNTVKSSVFCAESLVEKIACGGDWAEVATVRRQGEITIVEHEQSAGFLRNDVLGAVNAATAQRLLELRKDGRCPTHDAELSKLLREEWRFTSLDESVLEVIADHALILLRAENVTADAVGEFLFWFSCCTQKGTCAKIAWPSLSRLSSQLLMYQEDSSRTCLLMGVVGGCRLKHFTWSSCVGNVCDKYGERLHELTDLELCNVAEMLANVFFFGYIYHHVAHLIAGRAHQLDLETRERVLMIFRFRSLRKLRASESSLDVIVNFAKDLGSMSDDGVAAYAHLCATQGHLPSNAPVKDEFERRWKSFSPQQLCSMLFLFATYSLVDQDVLWKLVKYVNDNKQLFKPFDIQCFLRSLCMESFGRLESAQLLANVFMSWLVELLTAKRICPTTAVVYLECLAKLSLFQCQVFPGLVNLAVCNFHSLTTRQICVFFDALLTGKDRQKYIDLLLPKMKSCAPVCKNLTEAKELCERMVRLQLVERHFLVNIVARSINDLMRGDRWSISELAPLLLCLSQLRIAFPLLNSIAYKYVNNICRTGLLPVVVEHLVNVVWALAVHNLFPMSAVHLMLTCEPSQVERFQQETVRRLHEVNVLMRCHTAGHALSPGSFVVLRKRLEMDVARSLENDAAHIGSDLETLLSPDAVRLNVVTADLFHMSAAVLAGPDGRVKPWPDSPPRPSCKDVLSWKANGYVPVAVLVLDPSSFAAKSTYLLGPAFVLSRCLEESGWRVACISLSEYTTTNDRCAYLRERLGYAGIHDI